MPSFARKPLVVRLDVSHEASAYVGEPLPIKISITNDDERAIELEMSTALQPGHESDGMSTLPEWRSCAAHPASLKALAP